MLRHFPEFDSRRFILTTGIVNGEEVYKRYCLERNIKNPITVLSVYIFEFLLKNVSSDFFLTPVEDYKIGKREKKFLCFNKVHRPHRILITAKLMERNLISQSYYSFQGGWDNWIDTCEFFKIFDPMVKEQFIKHKNLFPMTLNIKPGRENPVDISDEDREYFKNSYFSVINETVFFGKKSGINNIMLDAEDGIFITEKTGKALAAKHPFIIAGNPGSIKVLRERGYKTFHPWINESYDDIEDDFKRMDAIVAEIERLCAQTDEEWLHWQAQIKEAVDHNYEFFKKVEDYSAPFNYQALFGN